MPSRRTSAGPRARTRPLRALRARAAQVRAWGVRARTLTGGVMLAGVLLLGLALVGGVSQVVDPAQDPEPAPSHLGPLTAIQPELREALLTEQDLPEGTAPSPEPSAAAPATDPSLAAPSPLPAAEPDELGELCQSLLEGATDLSRLSGMWRATPPQETTSQHTPRRDGGMLDQLISVFDTGHATEAYGRLREAAGGCDEVGLTLDGEPVTVLLEELSWDRRESARIDEAYATSVVVEGGERTMTGWLALDRLGPVISVLRHLEPAEPDRSERHRFQGLRGLHSDPDPAETRRAALGKLRSLLRALRG